MSVADPISERPDPPASQTQQAHKPQQASDLEVEALLRGAVVISAGCSRALWKSDGSRWWRLFFAEAWAKLRGKTTVDQKTSGSALVEQPGIEPGTSDSACRVFSHWATRPPAPNRR